MSFSVMEKGNSTCLCTYFTDKSYDEHDSRKLQLLSVINGGKNSLKPNFNDWRTAKNILITVSGTVFKISWILTMAIKIK